MLIAKENVNEPPLYMPSQRISGFKGGTIKRGRTFVGSDCQGEVKEISRIWEVCAHRRRQVEFGQILYADQYMDRYRNLTRQKVTFLDPNLSGTRLGFLLGRRILVLLHAPDLRGASKRGQP